MTRTGSLYFALFDALFDKDKGSPKNDVKEEWTGAFF